MDYRIYDGLDVVVGSGVGGTSLLFSGFMIEPPARYFADWPLGIDRDTLAPHYRRVWDFLDVKRYPFDRAPYHDTNRIRVLEKAVERIGRGRLNITDLAMQFLDRPEDWGTSFINKHGATQNGCLLCAECNLGCNYHAKNSTDVNYLYRARALGAEVLPGHQADFLEPLHDGSGGRGWRVGCVQPGGPRDRTASYTARTVVLAGGALGSTELLLRNRDVHHTLPELSPRLGHGFSGNGNNIALLTNLSDDPVPLEPYRGPTLVVGIELDDFYIEDTGIADFVTWYLDGIVPDPNLAQLKALVHRGTDKLKELVGAKPSFGIIADLASILQSETFTSRSTYVISIGRDLSEGVLALDAEGSLRVNWRNDDAYLDKVRGAVEDIAGALGGESTFGKRFSFHLLGGCNLGERRETGVVDGNGEVFGAPGLYVIDGAAIPRCIGVNPALTISALSDYLSTRLAERLAAKPH
jgi:cholesterol oxidase